jgi:hypothetical protein
MITDNRRMPAVITMLLKNALGLPLYAPNQMIRNKMINTMTMINFLSNLNIKIRPMIYMDLVASGLFI